MPALSVKPSNAQTYLVTTCCDGSTTRGAVRAVTLD